MDHLLFKSINNIAGSNTVLDQFMIFMSSYVLYVLLALVIASFFFQKYRSIGIIGIGSVVITLLTNYLFSFIYFRERPFVQDQVNLLIEKGASASFPSDQASISFAIATVIFLHHKKAGIFVYILACLLGFSRIYVGHHFPLDILGGIIVGTCISLYLHKAVEKNITSKKGFFSV